MSVETGEETPGEELSLDELRAAQQEHREKVETARQVAAAEEAHKQELQAQAVAGYGTRIDLTQELAQVQSDIELEDAKQTKEKIAKTEELLQTERQKIAELKASETVFAQLQERIQSINEMLVGVPPEEISAKVQQGLGSAQQQFDALSESRAVITASIEQTRNDMISDEEMEKYKAMVARQEEIAKALTALEETPALAELLTEEAKNESELRTDFKDAAVRASLRSPVPGAPTTELIYKLADQFLTEEFVSREVNQIKDPKQTLDTMRQLTANFISGFGQDSHQFAYKRDPRGNDIPDFDSKEDQFLASLFFKAMIGLGNSGTVLHFAESASHGLPDQSDEYKRESFRALSAEIKKHLGTVNLLRASSLGASQARETIINENIVWTDFDMKLRMTNEFEINWGPGPILPKDATPVQIEKIKAEYDKNFQAAKERAEAVLEKRAREVQERKTQLAAANAELQAKVDRAEQIDRELKARSQRNFVAELSDVNQRLNSYQNAMASTEAELGRTSRIRFGRRSALEAEITELTGNAKVEQDQIAKILEEQETTSRQITALQQEKRAIGSTFEMINRIANNKAEIIGIR